MTRLVAAIQNGIWAIRPQEALAHLHIAMRIVKGDLAMPQNDGKKPKSVSFVDENGVRNRRREDVIGDCVACYDISGVITKADQECGPDGTVSLMRQMLKNDRDPNIEGHFLCIDSGGGEAKNIAEVARMIRNECQKPVVAHYNGLCASAAYGIAAAADEIYATLETDICGSVGVMMTLTDWKAYYESEGLKIYDIYADQSNLKNSDFHEALAGNFEPLKTNLLNPFADDFINLIKELRPQTIGHDDIFKGKTYMSTEARDNGLIDGMLTQQEAINRVFALADAKESQQNDSIFQNQNTTIMKVFGIEFGNVPTAQDGSVTLSAEQYAQLTQASQAHQATAQGITDLTATLKAETEARAALEAKFVQVLERVNLLEAEPAAQPAQANGAQMPQGQVELKEWQKFNQQIQADMQSGKRIFE